MKLYLASQCIYVDNSLSVIIVILLSKTSGRMKSRITLTSFLCKVGIFHLPNTFRNFDGKAHQVKNIVPLTQFHSFPALAKIGDGGSHITMYSLRLVNPCETCRWNMHFHQNSFQWENSAIHFQTSNYSCKPGNFPVECMEHVPLTSQPKFAW